MIPENSPQALQMRALAATTARSRIAAAQFGPRSRQLDGFLLVPWSSSRVILYDRVELIPFDKLTSFSLKI